jgi:NAD(P)-dependent dehydrogenase (short-subunit alcohol dehydrogenase family)
MPFGPFAHYGAAKAALDYYSRTLAMELASSRVRVYVVSPGVISTPGSEEFAKTTPGFPGIIGFQQGARVIHPRPAPTCRAGRPTRGSTPARFN